MDEFLLSPFAIWQISKEIKAYTDLHSSYLFGHCPMDFYEYSDHLVVTLGGLHQH